MNVTTPSESPSESNPDDALGERAPFAEQVAWIPAELAEVTTITRRIRERNPPLLVWRVLDLIDAAAQAGTLLCAGWMFGLKDEWNWRRRVTFSIAALSGAPTSNQTLVGQITRAIAQVATFLEAEVLANDDATAEMTADLLQAIAGTVQRPTTAAVLRALHRSLRRSARVDKRSLYDAIVEIVKEMRLGVSKDHVRRSIHQARVGR